MRRIGIWLGLLLASGCSSVTYPIQAGDLDAGTNPDHSVLVSEQIPNPTDAQKSQLVVVAAHGYTATTYEIHPVAEYLRSQGMLVSEVLLGAHGTNIQDFAKSTWRTWQAPMVAEYNNLKTKGYQNIAILGTSTGGTLWLEALSSGALSPVPKRIVLVAPLIEYQNKLASYAGLLDMLGYRYIDTNPTGGSVGHWYRFRPASTVSSLVELTEIVKSRLKAGIPVPNDTKTLIIQSNGDTTVNPVSADIVRAGLTGVTLDRVHSDRHIPIWPTDVGPTPLNADEQTLRAQLFQTIAQHLAS